MEAENQIGQRCQTGKGREEKDDKRTFFPALSQMTNRSISCTGAHTAQKSNQRRQKFHVGEGGFYDKKAADKGSCHSEYLYWGATFF